VVDLSQQPRLFCMVGKMKTNHAFHAFAGDASGALRLPSNVVKCNASELKRFGCLAFVNVAIRKQGSAESCRCGSSLPPPCNRYCVLTLFMHSTLRVR
jgi:hypothetical protein